MTTITSLRALHAAATPGPWRVGSVSPHGSDDVCVHTVDGKHCIAFDCETPNESALIAAMRNALPALLDVAEAAEHAVGYIPAGAEVAAVPVWALNDIRNCLAAIKEQA